MRVIARGTRNGFIRNRVRAKVEKQLVKQQLDDAWYAEVSRAQWKNSAELKAQFGSASIVSTERVVFNIKGNDYRLVAAITYRHQGMMIKWLGSHEDTTKSTSRRLNMTNNVMQIQPVRTRLDHIAAVKRIEALMDAGVKPGTPEDDELEIWLTLVDADEAKAFQIDAPDPVTAIQFRMEQQGLSRKDIEPYIGSRARVSEIMNRKRQLTLDMVQRVREGLGISADLLIARYPYQLAPIVNAECVRTKSTPPRLHPKATDDGEATQVWTVAYGPLFGAKTLQPK